MPLLGGGCSSRSDAILIGSEMAPSGCDEGETAMQDERESYQRTRCHIKTGDSGARRACDTGDDKQEGVGSAGSVVGEQGDAAEIRAAGGTGRLSWEGWPASQCAQGVVGRKSRWLGAVCVF